MKRMTLPHASQVAAPSFSALGHLVPQNHGWFLHRVGRTVLRLFGWRLTGEFPDLAKFVIIVAPHTSNWDFPVGLAAKWVTRMRVTWLGKHTLFVPPLGWFMRALGGLPVNRHTTNELVESTTRRFAERESLVIALAPEGTRRRTDRWRSGFWHIARVADVPIVCVALDWGTKEVRVGRALSVRPELGADADIARIHAHYVGVRGYHPELQT